MTPVTVVTTWSVDQAPSMGKVWLTGASEWPTEWHRIVYGAKPTVSCRVPNTTFTPDRFRDVQLLIECSSTADRFAAHGKVPQPCWRSAEIQNGYSFRTDAVRFAWKAFALIHAARHSTDGILVWLDADVRTLRPPPVDLWEQLARSDVNWLDRPGRWPETGCIVLRMPVAWPLIQELQRRYESDMLFTHEQWHDAWIFMEALRKVTRQPGNQLKAVPMATQPPGVREGVWDLQPLLREYFSHEKGMARKQRIYG